MKRVSCRVAVWVGLAAPLLAPGCALRSARDPESNAPPAGGELLEFAAQPGEGFHFPFFLRYPKEVAPASALTLLVEPNNTGGGSDDLEKHRAAARRLATRSHAVALADRLGAPLLVPVFPRPETEWRNYTHALDRDSLEIRGGPLERLDRQLLHMIDHARADLSRQGVETRERVFIDGFSASGTFANRFAFLHPQRVQAAACGGVNGVPVVPAATWNGQALPFPIGLADVAEFSDAASTNGQRRAPQFIYMGAKDENDTLPFRDAWSEEESALIRRTLGERMMPDRWEVSCDAYRRAGYPAELKTYAKAGHEITTEILRDVETFFRAHAEP